MDKVKVAIIGSGPAGLTAAIYTARADLGPVVFEGIQPGGQLVTTTTIENFPGFPDGIDGSELMDRMRRQAERFGAKMVQAVVTGVDFSKRPFILRFGDGEQVEAESVIVASGASAKWIGLPSEQQLIGRGVSSCATCDGFFFRGKKVAVVGGGDTAMEDALHLTRFASIVYVIHRRNELRASKYMQQRAFDNEKISFIWDSVVEEVLGAPDTGVKGVKLKNVKTGETSTLEIDGLFVAIGHHPNTEFLAGQLELTDVGFIKAVDGKVRSSVDGVFVAGDVIDPRFRQAITAAGMGCMAALEAQEYLATH